MQYTDQRDGDAATEELGRDEAWHGHGGDAGEGVGDHPAHGDGRCGTTAGEPTVRVFATPRTGQPAPVQRGGMRVRPLGGAPGCLAMILFSVIASVVLTVVLNLLVR